MRALTTWGERRKLAKHYAHERAELAQFRARHAKEHYLMKYWPGGERRDEVKQA